MRLKNLKLFCDVTVAFFLQLVSKRNIIEITPLKSITPFLGGHNLGGKISKWNSKEISRCAGTGY